MAKKKQQITEDRNVVDEIVENASVPDTADNVPAPAADVVVAPSAENVETLTDVTADTDVAEALLEEETTAVAEAATLESDPINRPVQSEEKKTEEALADRDRKSVV